MKFGYLTVFALMISVVYSQNYFTNVSYGNEAQQNMDLYQPKNKTTKTIILIHGGAWVSGNKEDVKMVLDYIQKEFPDRNIANINYRLANKTSPGYPKQTDDIHLSIAYLKKRLNINRLSLSFVGLSSGSHLAMLYAYRYDHNKEVKAVANYVGPADFTAWNYASNITYNTILEGFVGPFKYWQNPGLYYTTSPTAWINITSAKTISFYGNKDPLIPNEQGELLKKRLDQAKVLNEMYRYNGGHGDWAPTDILQSLQKTVSFIKTYS